MRYADLVKPDKKGGVATLGFKFPKIPNARRQMRWGIEVEVVTVEDDDPQDLTDGFNGLPKPWQHKGDSSLGPNGREFYPSRPFVSLQEGLKAVRGLRKYLRDDFVADERCGLHIHIDAQAFGSGSSRQAFAQNIAGLEFLFYYVLPRSRRQGQYAQPTSWVGQNTRERDRYFGMNVCSYHKFRSLELRYHSGTYNVNRITQWVRLIWTLYKLGVANPRKLTELTDVINGAYVNGKQQKAWDVFAACLPSLGASLSYWRSRLERFRRHHSAPQQFGSNYTNWRQALRLRMPSQSYAGSTLLAAQNAVSSIIRGMGLEEVGLRHDDFGQQARILRRLSK